MKIRTLLPMAAPILLLLLFLGFSSGSDSGRPDPKHVEKVDKHLPQTAPAEPKRERNILIFSKTNGFRHKSIEIGAYALVKMGDETGAYSAIHTEDEEWFAASKLEQFDAVVFLNTTGAVFRPKKWPEDADERKEAEARELRLKQNLIDFVKRGGGLVGIHSATDTYHKWPEYIDMMGGRFAGHPWHEKVRLRNLEPDHPVNRPFGGNDYDVTDEIYQFAEGTAGREERRMLLALSGEIENLGKGRYGAEGFYPVSWIRRFGEGRNFYCSLGHREEIYWNPVVMKHYLAGIQYAMGDLAAPDEPRPDVSAH